MASTEESTDIAEEGPEYLREVTELKFQNISIKGYEKKAAAGFTREEYYAYRIVSMYVWACTYSDISIVSYGANAVLLLSNDWGLVLIVLYKSCSWLD